MPFMTKLHPVTPNTCTLSKAANGFILSNANMQLTIDSEKGIPSQFFDIKNSFDWTKICGHLEIYDELADRHFNTAESPNELSVEVEEGDNPTVTLFRR
jgi:hypothetical protein